MSQSLKMPFLLRIHLTPREEERVGQCSARSVEADTEEFRAAAASQQNPQAWKRWYVRETCTGGLDVRVRVARGGASQGAAECLQIRKILAVNMQTEVSPARQVTERLKL